MEGLAAAGLQLLAVVLIAPGIQGLIQRLKAMLQGRHGPGIAQPYFTLAKLWRRQDLHGRHSSWISALAPRLALGITLGAALAVPLFGLGGPGLWAGDFLVAVGLLALERYVLSLLGLDAGTPFGGLGSSRQSTLGALAEPALVALGLPWMVRAASTAWPALLGASAATAPTGTVRLFALAAAVIVVLAETGRLPVDNPDTHLELTMIHEAIVLEASGPQLGLLSLTQMIQQTVVLALASDLLVPWGLGPAHGILALAQPVWAVARWVALATAVAVAESLSTKLRFFRLPAYLGASVALSSAAAVLQVWGGR